MRGQYSVEFDGYFMKIVERKTMKILEAPVEFFVKSFIEYAEQRNIIISGPLSPVLAKMMEMKKKKGEKG